MKASGLTAVIIIFSGTLVSCAGSERAVVTSPAGKIYPLTWTAAEKKEDIVLHTLKETEHASHHIVRLKGAEKPHVHETHDLSVFVLKGKARLHLEGNAYIMKKGDGVDIPEGTLHWAENLSGQPSEVYAIFTPPYDGQDSKEIISTYDMNPERSK